MVIPPSVAGGITAGVRPETTCSPRRVSQLSSIPCQFSYSSGGSGIARVIFAYDTFLRWDNAKCPAPQCEVMVWAGHNSFPIGNCTGNNVIWNNKHFMGHLGRIQLGRRLLCLHVRPNGSVVWPVNSLPTSGSMNVDLKPFYQWLNDNRSGSGYYNNNMYLDVVEAGFEVVQGNGWAYINGWIDAQKGGSGRHQQRQAPIKSLPATRQGDDVCVNAATANGLHNCPV